MNLISEYRGIVTKKFNDFFFVDILDNGELNKSKRFLCKSRKSLKHQRKYIFVGDIVTIRSINYKDKTAVIDDLLDLSLIHI